MPRIVGQEKSTKSSKKSKVTPAPAANPSPAPPTPVTSGPVRAPSQSPFVDPDDYTVTPSLGSPPPMTSSPSASTSTSSPSTSPVTNPTKYPTNVATNPPTEVADANMGEYNGISSNSAYTDGAPTNDEECTDACPKTPTFRGIIGADGGNFGYVCVCQYDIGTRPPNDEVFDGNGDEAGLSGTGPLYAATGVPPLAQCGKWHPGLYIMPPSASPVVNPTKYPTNVATNPPTEVAGLQTFDPNYDCQSPNGCWEFLSGVCVDANMGESNSAYTDGAPTNDEECKDACPKTPTFRGIMGADQGDFGYVCVCQYDIDIGTRPPNDEVFDGNGDEAGLSGTGPLYAATGVPPFAQCGKWHPGLYIMPPSASPVVNPTNPPTEVALQTFDPNYDCQSLNGSDSSLSDGAPTNDEECKDACPKTPTFRGIMSIDDELGYYCVCQYDIDTLPPNDAVFDIKSDGIFFSGTGPVYAATEDPFFQCSKWHPGLYSPS
eukprot:scaffold21134_cov85-Cyclotella_meneghiniana.AAC.2